MTLALLRANRGFRVLWVSRATSVLGTSVGLVALLLYTATSTGQAAGVALLMLVLDLVPALLSPFTGVVADRVDLRRIMIWCEVGQGALVLAIAVLLPPLPVILALVLAAATLGRVFEPASRAAVPSLVGDGDLESANAAVGLGTNGLEVAGPVIAAVLLPVVGIQGLLAADALTFFASSVVLGRLPALPRVELDPASETASFLRHARSGVAYLWRTPLVRLVAASFFAIVAFNGVDDIALVFLAKGPLHGSDSAASLLYAGAGLGLLLGFVALGRFSWRVSTAATLLIGYGVSSLGNLLTGLAWAVGIAFAMQTVRGLGVAAMDTSVATLVQRAVPPVMQGRVFGNLYGVIGLAAGLSYVLGGLVVQLAGPRVALVSAGAGGVVTAAVAAVYARRVLTHSDRT